MSKFRTVEVSDPRFEHEGLREVTFKSPSLRRRADLSVYGGTSTSASSPPAASPTPLVILLHGVYGSHWAWSRKGGAHRTADRLIRDGSIPPLVLAMPSDGLWGDGSGYIRHERAGGPESSERAPDFERYILDEVPAAAAHAFPSVTSESPLFIAGLSMGGFGALKLGSKHPHRFRGVCAHSAITHFSQMARFVEEPLEDYGPLPEPERSVLHWTALNRATLPPLRFDCGTEDPQLADNRRLHADLTAAGIPHTYAEHPGGHNWPYWERHLEDTLRFFAGVIAHRPPE